MTGTLPTHPPTSHDAPSPSIELVIASHPRDLGGFSVRRALPSAQRRLVGPFVFFDHLGPARLAAGQGIDVRPHPHIGLATVTYLFDGEIVHRDSLGSHQAIRPGDVNWMLAGRGIVHSERSSTEARQRGVRVHGIQCWMALPTAYEEAEPSFVHHPAASLPRITRDGAVLNVIAGTAFGARSPVAVCSPTLYVHALLDPGARIVIDTEHAQRAVYVVEGTIACDGRVFQPGAMVVLKPGVAATIETPAGAQAQARVMLVGGAGLGGERYVEWNFVSSSRARIDRARDDWQNERFPTVPGDDVERIPLPAR